MELLFVSLAFGAGLTAKILAAVAVICIIYKLRLWRNLTVGALSAYVLSITLTILGSL